MRFALLGPLSVRDDEGPVKLAGKLRRTLLAALLLDAGTPVSADRLAGLLWGPDAAAGTSAALHTQLMRLRQALGDEDRVRAVPPGYLIEVGPGELDVQVFAEECAAGRRKLAEKEWAEASRRFGAALELWRGRPLADVPALADDLRIRELEETHVQALQGRIDAELNLSRHHELLGELRGLAGEHPRHEAFRGQLMLALYRAGHQDEATAAYDAYEESLLDELGIEPGTELRGLRDAIVRRDPALSPAPNPNAPHQLPADTRTFTGRVTELAELVTAASGAARAVVISALDGMGGIGKTALAVHTAHRVADRFPDGQLFIDLRGHTANTEPLTAGDALAYLLRSLGVPTPAIPDGVTARAELYQSRLAESRTLILLDNAADPGQVRPLLPNGPGCLTLVTSRDRLAELGNARSLTVDILGEAAAVELLAKVAGPTRGLTDSPAVRELAALCGYLPLALRIVAARLRHTRALTVEDVLAELRDKDARLGRLTDGERDLTSVFESSFGNLPQPEQRLLRLLGVLPGPDLDAYAAANLLDTDIGTAERLLGSLLDRNLLIQQVEGRYGMHDLVRAYTKTLLDAEGDQARAARDRLLDYHQHTMWTAARHHTTAIRWRDPAAGFAGPRPDLTDMARALAWLRTERAGLLAENADPSVPMTRRIDLALGLASLLQLDGPWREAVALQETAEREAAALGDTQSRADALRNLGQVLVLSARAGSYDRAAETFQRARELYREVGNRPGEADTLFRTGRVLTFKGEYEAALVPERAALVLFREIGDRHGEALALQSVGDTERLIGRNTQALEACLAALAIHRELGNRQAEATAVAKLGLIQSDLGDLHDALDSLGAALAINREHRQLVGEGAALYGLGTVHTMQGSFDQAGAALHRALELFESLDYAVGMGVVCQHLGSLRTRTGEPRAGVEYLERALAIFLTNDNQADVVEARRELGWARARAGDPEGRELIQQALAAYRSTTDDPPGEVLSLVHLGNASLDVGDPRGALALFEEALPLARRISRAVAEARILDGIARCRVLLGDREAALEPLREAVAMYRRMGLAELADAEERLVALGSLSA